jgi:UDP-N-acetylmuramoyl-tripeptide--D-alanyl-D-alanine ligase
MARWLRVLQREHYDPTALIRFLGRWSSPSKASAKRHTREHSIRPFTLSHALFFVMVGTILLHNYWCLAVAVVLYGVFCPQGLAIKGRTSPLEWTRRLRTVAIVATVIGLVIAALGTLSSQHYLGAVFVVLAVPLLLDVSTRLLHPFEERRAKAFVKQAAGRLDRIKPRIVAITGSYGKTSTKNHLVELLEGTWGVVASPRSFNNRAGLSRAINENLADGTKIFIAEMGTYGPGEIRELTSWCVPEIAVVTAIGPVHLERMKSLEIVARSKFEITERANTVVVNLDDEILRTWLEKLLASGKRVVTASSVDPSADVRVTVDSAHWTITIHGVNVGTIDEIVGVQPTNVACAIATALALGVSERDIASRLSLIRPVANRLNVVSAESGVVVIDDTFNANPASAIVALKALSSLPVRGRRVVVTPGLVELGKEQHVENLKLSSRIAAVPAELVVVARTNVNSLTSSFREPVRRFDTREEAVAWVRSSLVAGDAVLYLNDLPDHYP